MTWLQIVGRGMEWFWAYVLGYIFGFCIIISAVWLFFASIWYVLTW